MSARGRSVCGFNWWDQSSCAPPSVSVPQQVHSHTHIHTPELLTLQLYTFPAIRAVRISDIQLIFHTTNSAFGISADKITGFQDVDVRRICFNVGKN